MILQNRPFFVISRDWEDDLENLTTPALLPKFLPTTVKCHEVKTKNKKGLHFPDDQFLAQNVVKTIKKGHLVR